MPISHDGDVPSPPAVFPVCFEQVVEAADRLRGSVIRTPAEVSTTLSERTGAHIVVKFENMQHTGSFKDRGSLNRILGLTAEERSLGIIAMSAGNHAQGVAYHAGRLGIPATVVMPATAPFTKVSRTRALGAEVVQAGASLTEASAVVDTLIAQGGQTLIHPYDHPLIIAGQGTCGIELFEDHPDLDVVVVPVGGGGLISGIALAASGLVPKAEIIGVQTELYPAMVRRREGRVDGGRGGNSIADGIAVKRPGRLTGSLIDALVTDLVTVSEARIEEALGLLIELEKTVVEGAGAASFAAILDNPQRFAGRRVGLILSGGNIDPRLLASVIQRSLFRQGRMTRMRVEADDLPGRLADVLATVGRLGGNIVDVSHQRLITSVPVRRVDLDITIETLDHGHLTSIVDALEADGHRVEFLK